MLSFRYNKASDTTAEQHSHRRDSLLRTICLTNRVLLMIVNNEIGVTLCPTSRALELEKQQDQNQTTES
jgi:hypothetical protein